MSEEKNIARRLEEIANDICVHYCKWPEQYDEEEHDGVELTDSEICSNCPLNDIW